MRGCWMEVGVKWEAVLLEFITLKIEAIFYWYKKWRKERRGNLCLRVKILIHLC